MTKELKEQFRESLLIAKMLAGSWRDALPTLEMSSEDLEESVIPLQNVHGLALAWWRVKDTELRETNSAQIFEDAFRYYSINSRAKEWQLKEVLSLLRSNEIEPIVVKGWAINRLYPHHALRYFSDNDFLIHPKKFKEAREILSSYKGPALSADTHKGTSNDTTKELDIETFENLFGRSELVKLGENEIRVLSKEDHLRLLTTHWLQDGAERATGLCDIALLIENYSSDFNWEICLGKDKKRARWIICTIELAHQLLDADVSKLPNEVRCKKLPKWLLPSVLKAWTNHIIFTPLSDDLNSPITAVKNLRMRWPPNPIHSTVRLNGSFTNFPRLPYQVANYVIRSFRFFKKAI